MNKKVSVLIITYNHEAYVSQALESVLMQQTNFDYEVVIGDDCSTDRTRKIVIDFQRRYPNQIRLLLPNNNLGMHNNYIETLKACTGKYVAVLEGDDYWTTSDKLQKQADFLDAHPGSAICFHNVEAFYEDNRSSPWNLCPKDQKAISTLEDLLVANFIPTCTVMFRNGLIREFPQWVYTLMMIDWPLHIFNAQHGDIGYLNEVMSVYRIHPNGTFSMKSNIVHQLEFLKMYEWLNNYLPSEYHSIIKNRMFSCWFNLTMAYLEECDMASARRFFYLCLKERPFTKNAYQKLKLIFKFNAPISFKITRRIWHLTR
jgi:glycosyltransferase involved in cell wall biosynthesis